MVCSPFGNSGGGGLKTVPGIDDVLAVDQVLTANRLIQGNDGFSFRTVVYNSGPTNFVAFGNLIVAKDFITFSLAKGDGAGNLVSDQGIFLGNGSTILFRDTTNELGAEYAGDYSGNNASNPRWINDKEYADFKSLLAVNVQSTGLIDGGVVSLASVSTIDITAGQGYIADFATPTAPVLNRISWNAIVGYSVLGLGSDGSYMVGITSAGAVFETPFEALTSQQRRDNIIVGSYRVLSGSIFAITTHPLNLGYDGITTAKDFIRDVMGPSNIEGNVIREASTDLTLSNTGGTIFIVSANFRNNTEVPDEVVIPTAATMTFLRVFRQASPSNQITADGTPTTVVNPNSYDDGSGTLATVGNNNWTVQVVGIAPDGSYIVSYGQEEFNTLSDAETAFINGTLQFVEFRSLSEGTVRRVFLFVKQGATNLSLPAQAVFRDDGKFRGGGAAIGGGGIAGINTPGGANTNVQFNDNGAFGGSSSLTWTGSTLNVTGSIVATGQVLVNTTGILSRGAGNNFLFSSNTYPGSGATNTVMGVNTGQMLTTGSFNTSFGGFSGDAITAGSSNSLFGEAAGTNITEGDQNTFVGQSIGTTLITGNNNLLIGQGVDVPASNTNNYMNIKGVIFANLSSKRVRIGTSTGVVSGSDRLQVEGTLLVDAQLHFPGDNVLIGANALSGITSGTKNIAIGASALQSLTVTGNSIGIGNQALQNATGTNNIAIGSNAGQANTTAAKDNIYIGQNAAHLAVNADDSNNVVIGSTALAASTVVKDNVILGEATVLNCNSVATSVIIGAKTVSNTKTSINNSIIIGANVDPGGPAILVNWLEIGTLLFGNLADKNIAIGSFDGVFDAQASLELVDNDKYLIPNKVTTTQETSWTIVPDGAVWYNTTLHKLRVNENGVFKTVTTS